MHRIPKFAGIAVLIFAATPSLARPPGWGTPGWGDSAWDSPNWRGSDWERNRRLPSRNEGRAEGEVEVTRFVAQDGSEKALGRGIISVVASEEGQPSDRADLPFEHPPQEGEARTGDYGPPDQPGSDGTPKDERSGATFEAAVIDQLVKAGYETRPASGAEGQRAELRIVHGVIEPQEPPHKPVSGTMEVGISNRGSMTGMGINIDLTKPQKALLSTRLEARIRNSETGAVIWEGRAEIATRDGDADWPTQKIAARLAEALFREFPGKPGETYSVH